MVERLICPMFEGVPFIKFNRQPLTNKLPGCFLYTGCINTGKRPRELYACLNGSENMAVRTCFVKPEAFEAGLLGITFESPVVHNTVGLHK